MNRFIIHSALVVGLLLCWINEATGQQQKIGYVDTNYILAQMPEYEGIQQQLKSMGAEWNKKLNEMDAEIERIRSDFESKKVLYTDNQKKEKQQDIAAKVEARRQFMEQKFGAEGEYFQKQKELLEPIQQTVFNAVTTVANRQGIDFVFDRAQNSGLLYGNKEFNLNEEILQEMDITLKEQGN